VRIHWEVVQFKGPAYFRKLPAIQWYSLRGYVLHQFAPVAAMDLRAAFTRRTDECDRETAV